MNADVLATKVTEGIAVITLGSAKRMYFDAEMGDSLTESLQEFAGDPNIRVVIVTGGTPGYFNRHFSIRALIEFAEAVRASGRQWPDNAAYHGGFFDQAMALCETMPKPVIAAISGTALAGAFESPPLEQRRMQVCRPDKCLAAAQLCHSISVRTIGAVIAEPVANPTNDTLIARPCSDGGNQRETARAMFGKAPASPAPNRNRISSNDRKPAAAPVSAVNADHQSTIRVSAILAPKRSPSHPLGISNAA